MRRFVVLLLAVMLSFPLVAKEHKGKGAGGARDEHASETGMEKGKAWAGDKEKKAKKDDGGVTIGDRMEKEKDDGATIGDRMEKERKTERVRTMEMEQATEEEGKSKKGKKDK